MRAPCEYVRSHGGKDSRSGATTAIYEFSTPLRNARAPSLSFPCVISHSLDVFQKLSVPGSRLVIFHPKQSRATFVRGEVG